MKRLLLMLIPVLAAACGSGVEQYRAGIEALSSNWVSATSKATELNDDVTTSLSDLARAASVLRPSAEELAALDADQKRQWESAKDSFNQALQAFAPLRSEIGQLINNWGTETEKVQALKDGLANGKLEGDVLGRIGELNTLASQATDKIAAWRATYDQTNAAADAALNMLKESFTTVNSSAPAK